MCVLAKCLAYLYTVNVMAAKSGHIPESHDKMGKRKKGQMPIAQSLIGDTT